VYGTVSTGVYSLLFFNGRDHLPACHHESFQTPFTIRRRIRSVVRCPCDRGLCIFSCVMCVFSATFLVHPLHVQYSLFFVHLAPLSISCIANFLSNSFFSLSVLSACLVCLSVGLSGCPHPPLLSIVATKGGIDDVTGFALFLPPFLHLFQLFP
jgi:hypothetical protein